MYEIVKEEVMCTTPNFHRVGEYLPQKYYSIPRMIGCTPIEATFLLRLRKFTGFANYFNDILELFHYSSPKEAMEYLKSLQPKNIKEFIK